MYEYVRTRNHVVRTVYQSSHIWTWKEYEADRSLMDVRTDASWNRSFSIQWRVRTERYVVRTDDAGLSGIRTGWTRRPDGWNSRQMGVRTGWHFIRTADRESEIFYLFRSAESSENALTSEIPVYSIFTHKWFCPNTEWGQNTNIHYCFTCKYIFEYYICVRSLNYIVFDYGVSNMIIKKIIVIGPCNL
jgi:hypothetical protein